ncbi:RNase adapter RapZ [Pseudoalteromonas sp. SR44-5]|uniref:RNase adapter RapZ n=1 Tax=Pseudoalteromonas rhizosphaerae TaxID=2518973 RepID=A0ABW8KT84_9GAMM|nr:MULTISPECIES: RNase adapter RapZ [Pseudoalteromonas]MBB1335442.1 RNase adapter RapZ [Pseudoalteromonas sp. SR41-6]MBB1343441.1 RNase adapter RapZ [Pseudoalteromonas sp. SR45-6]MBB1368823.1 RNase adapter RapZ [Pseudoalteromonas sp. SR44-5]MBB1419237.1 RNase adapter RapZ [Pseudoalteromonas sp. SG44-1]MBB1424065.1 RNase adapter RapZ [Pseudoalteromonas sp. SG43-7]
MELIIISGRSGSGKSVALRVVEDLGYYCVDNIPVNLLPSLVRSVSDNYDKIAVSIDVRNLPKEQEEFNDILEYLPGFANPTLFYLDSDDQTLIKRFSETRRLHPLSLDSLPLDLAIKQEKVLLDVLTTRADFILDTTDLSVHQLAESIREKILGKKDKKLIITFESFGFKYGIPKEADYVFDARFLPNPHWEPELKPLTGLDQPVKDYLASHSIVQKFTWQIQTFVQTWLPHLERNNRSYLTIAIGCTGGQHRSVYLAQTIGESFSMSHSNVKIRHREQE